jgi:hypothetical protein
VEVKIEVGIGSKAEGEALDTSAGTHSVNRRATVSIARDEIFSAAINIAAATERNRTGMYMRRHRKAGDSLSALEANVNRPIRAPQEPPKLLMAEHSDAMGFGYVSPSLTLEGPDKFHLMQSVIAVSVSDIASNLLRPCFSVEPFGQDKRAFFFEDEPIEDRQYWAACYFECPGELPPLRFCNVTFKLDPDRIYSADGEDLVPLKLKWAMCLVPLVRKSAAVPLVEIAQNDYDLRHIFGRNASEDYFTPYRPGVWFNKWDEEVAARTAQYLENGLRPEVYYHSALAVDASGNIRIYQCDSALDKLAELIAWDGMVAAGLLDSGGSCALYDPWLRGYLNHGWYYREPRGAALAFQLNSYERIPVAASWFSTRARE